MKAKRALLSRREPLLRPIDGGRRSRPTALPSSSASASAARSASAASASSAAAAAATAAAAAAAAAAALLANKFVASGGGRCLLGGRCR